MADLVDIRRLREPDALALAARSVRAYYAMLSMIAAIRTICNEEADDRGPVDTRIDRIKALMSNTNRR